MTLSILFSLPATKPRTTMLLNVFEELRQPRSASVQRYVRRKREVITIPRGPGQRTRDALLRSQRAYHIGDELDDDFLCNTYMGFVQVFGFDAREVVTRLVVQVGSNEGEDEFDDDDVAMSVPVVVDAELERAGPGYPIISDALMGEAEAVVCEAEANRRNLQ
ncbi:hypothetical protein JVU11DRAFT_8565 [Chiua virens]|nr:hypothetical protein JVU11DRAFT_8565 [Chiua virens]